MPEDVGATLLLMMRATDGTALGLPAAPASEFKLPGVTSPCATPIPVKETVRGLMRVLSATVSVAVRIPGAEGVKVTVMRQFSSGLSVLGLTGQFPPAT